jgi:hypothetical protein
MPNRMMAKRAGSSTMVRAAIALSSSKAGPFT